MFNAVLPFISTLLAGTKDYIFRMKISYLLFDKIVIALPNYFGKSICEDCWTQAE